MILHKSIAKILPAQNFSSSATLQNHSDHPLPLRKNFSAPDTHKT
jgi:hypothetical protein